MIPEKDCPICGDGPQLEGVERRYFYGKPYTRCRYHWGALMSNAENDHGVRRRLLDDARRDTRPG
jgi:hypothetical protein